jgi:ethanolamine utilization cobalamin adenosyltransferase
MMTDNMKLALFRKALKTLDAEIEKTECELAENAVNHFIGDMPKCIARLGVYDVTKARIVNRIEKMTTGETE